MQQFGDIVQPLIGILPFLGMAVVFGLLWWWKASSKKQTRGQECHLHTEDGRIVPIKMDVLYGCIAHDSWEEAWAVHPSGVCRSREGNSSVLVLNEREAQPFNLAGTNIKRTADDTWALVKDIEKESRKRSHRHLEKHERSNMVADTLQITVLCLMGCLALALILSKLNINLG